MSTKATMEAVSSSGVGVDVNKKPFLEGGSQ